MVGSGSWHGLVGCVRMAGLWLEARPPAPEQLLAIWWLGHSMVCLVRGLVIPWFGSSVAWFACSLAWPFRGSFSFISPSKGDK